MASVVSTVAGGLETPDFLELRKGRAASEAHDAGPRSLYQVVPERQTNVRGLMGSERGYDVSAVASSSHANIPVLGEERSSRVSYLLYLPCSSTDAPTSARTGWTFPLTRPSLRVSRRRSFVVSTMLTRGDQLASLVQERTFPTLWRKRWRAAVKSRRRRNGTRRRRARNSSFELNFVFLYFFIELLAFCTSEPPTPACFS